MTGLLASVANLPEARIALVGGADIIDLKNPAAGALGALSIAEVQHIVQALGGQVPLSATVGDLPMAPASLRQAASAMVATDVNYVKIGFFPDGDWPGCLSALAELAQNGRLVAVLFADTQPALHWVESIAVAGFTGVMLDTMDKSRGSLRQCMTDAFLAQFIAQARKYKLLCGLAGSLRIEDISPLLTLSPHYLGFRGALCQDRQRTAGLNADVLARVRGLINQEVPDLSHQPERIFRGIF